MRKRLLFLLLGALFMLAVTTACAQQPVTFGNGSTKAQGLFYSSQGAGKHPAIIVIHEWWGLNDWVKQQAAEFSRKGYVTLAIDLYRGQVATTAELAHELSRGLPQDQAVSNMNAAMAYLASRKDVDKSRIGVVGWCMGGSYAALFAVEQPTLRAVAINYGALPTDKSSLAHIQAAILGNFGGQDHGISPDSVYAFETSLRLLGKSVDVKIYPQAGHAFENPNNESGYRPADAADALARIDRFFKEKLQP